MMNTWIIYVGGKSATNYAIGKRDKVWGLKEPKNTPNLTHIKKDDEIIFIHHIKRPKNKFPIPLPGFPRIKKVEYFKFEGVVKEIVRAKVTKGFYKDTTPVWPDNTYPYRFNFEIQSLEKDIDFTVKNFGTEFIEKTLLSFHSKGDAEKLHTTQDISLTEGTITLDANSQAFSSQEGAIAYRIIKEIVRDTRISKLKKDAHLEQYGKFFCEVCNFSFSDFYGDEYDYIECHHIAPLSETGETQTQLSDLILLCANCHRVVHQTTHAMTIEKLKELVCKSTSMATNLKSS